MTYSKNWKIMEGRHANHEITIRYSVYDSQLAVKIKGPRAGSSGKDRYVKRTKKQKVNRKLPIRPAPGHIADNACNLYYDAEDRIDHAIAAHAKKYDEDYQ